MTATLPGRLPRHPERANVVLTQSDMLHAELPHHTKWAKAFENLRYIVIDELHSYRGVYGSHLANAAASAASVRNFTGRLRSFICCSATIANPRGSWPRRSPDASSNGVGERRAVGRKVCGVLQSAPVVNKALGIRRH
jgi:DEAD/DEAH box helicase domain-containing protein